MATIKPASEEINIAFPVAGIDNNSQGFRDNFNHIQQALYAVAAILEESGVTIANSTVALDGEDYTVTLTISEPSADRTITLPDNSGTVITTGSEGAVTNNMLANSTVTINGVEVELGGEATLESGVAAVALEDLAGGAIIIDYNDGEYQYVATGDTAASYAFSIDNFGEFGTLATLTLEVTQNNDGENFTFVDVIPASWIELPITTTPAGTVHVFELFTRDGGITVYLKDYQAYSA